MLDSYIKYTYLQKIWHDQKYILLGLTLFSFLFEFAFAWLLFEANFKAIFESVVDMLPTALMSFIGITVGGEFYGSQLLSFGYSHPLILISLSLIPIGIPARYIAGEVEHKTMDLLMARSLHRSVIPTHLFIFLFFSLTVQVIALFSGTYLGYVVFSLEIDILGYIKVALITFLFFLSIGSLTLAISSYQFERGKAISKAVTLLVLLYFYDTIIRLNKSLEHLTAYSYFNLFQPARLLKGEINFINAIIFLVIITFLFLIVSIIHFNKRDL
jgi:ABC-type transport system involved in multi-copper enzyme maturation permease subunit